MIWFTADTHFNHANIIKYCNRPFSGIKEMNEFIIKRWVNDVAKDDIVYHLGDFGFGNISNIATQVTGKIHLIKGGHDKSALQCKNRFESISPMMEITVDNIHIILCHFAMRVWNMSHFNSWHLYGHSHGNLPPLGKSWDVGVDNNHFRLLSFEQVKHIMETRPDNINLVKEDDR